MNKAYLILILAASACTQYKGNITAPKDVLFELSDLDIILKAHDLQLTVQYEKSLTNNFYPINLQPATLSMQAKIMHKHMICYATELEQRIYLNLKYPSNVSRQWQAAKSGIANRISEKIKRNIKKCY